MTHFGGHLRDPFINWIEDRFPATVIVEENHEPTEWAARKLLGVLTHCTDVLPGEYCDELDMPRGSTYAAAAQKLLREERLLIRIV